MTTISSTFTWGGRVSAWMSKAAHGDEGARGRRMRMCQRPSQAMCARTRAMCWTNWRVVFPFPGWHQERVASQVFIPFSVGGGVRSVQDEPLLGSQRTSSVSGKASALSVAPNHSAIAPF